MSDPIVPKLDDYGVQVGENSWLDSAGLEGMRQPGRSGDRRNPIGEFPTGPETGERLPEIVALAHTGSLLDVHQFRDGRPAAVMFFRSAVW